MNNKLSIYYSKAPVLLVGIHLRSAMRWHRNASHEMLLFHHIGRFICMWSKRYLVNLHCPHGRLPIATTYNWGERNTKIPQSSIKSHSISQAERFGTLWQQKNSFNTRGNRECIPPSAALFRRGELQCIEMELVGSFNQQCFQTLLPRQ